MVSSTSVSVISLVGAEAVDEVVIVSVIFTSAITLVEAATSSRITQEYKR